jgi:hypothetical protein
MTYLTNLCFRREMCIICPGWSSRAMESRVTTNAKNASKRVKEKPQLDGWETFSLWRGQAHQNLLHSNSHCLPKSLQLQMSRWADYQFKILHSQHYAWDLALILHLHLRRNMNWHQHKILSLANRNQNLPLMTICVLRRRCVKFLSVYLKF